ncbi:MAG: OsmC family protein [Anaerolineales bacterium]
MTEEQPNVEVKWVEGLQFLAQANGSHGAFVVDGTPDLGGLGTGVRPMEALLASLASCTGMDVISVLRKKRQDVRAFRVLVRGERAQEHPRRWVKINLEYVVTGVGLSEEAVARAIELSLTKYCGVRATLNAEITSTYRLIEVNA